MHPIRVAVLAFNGVSLFHLSVPGVVLGTAQSAPGEPLYEVSYCAESPGSVRSDQGIGLEVTHGLELMEASDVIVIPAWGDQSVAASAALVQALQLADAQGKLIVGLCLGAFVLGDAGLLDGKEATTHWAARYEFAQRFPDVRFRPEVLYVSDGNIMTSAGTVAAIDCCLHLIRQRLGADVANRTAKMLVTPPHRQGGQAQYIEHPVPQLSSETHLSDVLAWARMNLSHDLSLDLLADRAKMSRRTFTRKFKEATGSTVSKWLNAERVVRAQELLETTDLPIECVAGEAGFGTPLSLRQQFAIHLGTSPSEYRRAFFRDMSLGRKASDSEPLGELPPLPRHRVRRTLIPLD